MHFSQWLWPSYSIDMVVLIVPDEGVPSSPEFRHLPVVDDCMKECGVTNWLADVR